MKKYINRILLAFLIGLGTFSSVNAQEFTVDITGTIRFSSNVTSTVYNLVYGVGTIYTDTTDREFEHQIPPFVPPEGYLAYFNRKCDIMDGDDPCYWKENLLALPDSVIAGKTRFSLTYSIGLKNTTTEGFNVTILNPDFPPGVDSIRLVDRVAPKAFSETFTGPVVTRIEDRFTSVLDMTVYYNLEASSINTLPTVRPTIPFSIYPNVIATNSAAVRFRGDLTNVQNVVLYDAAGREVERMTVDQTVSDVTMNTAGLSSGTYRAVAIALSDRVLAVSTLVIVR